MKQTAQLTDVSVLGEKINHSTLVSFVYHFIIL